MIRVDDPADPQRCQGKAPDGQCMNRAEVGSDYCMVHNGGLSLANAEEQRLYHLTEARNRQRLAQLTEHDPVTTLREVTALAVRLVEKRVNLIQSDDDLSNAYGDLITLQLTVERLKKSAHQIEQNLGVLSSKPTVLRLGQLLIQIVAEELSDLPEQGEMLQRITDSTIQAIVSANNANEITAAKMPNLRLRKPSNEPIFKIEDVEDKVRLAELSKHERLKSLNEDIGLQVVLLERRWNMVRTPHDLIHSATQLANGLKLIEKLVKSAHDIEQTLGNLLNKETLSRLGNAFSQILVDELEGIEGFEQTIDRIMDRVTARMLSPAGQKLLSGPQATS
jgi:hypothetical protein